MSFTPGNFDLAFQVNTSALSVLTDIILKRLEQENKTKFSQTVGRGALAFGIDVELTDINIPEVRSLDMSQRFKKGNTLATFEVEAELTFTLFGANLNDNLGVKIKDLQIGIFTTEGGLPVGVALGFKELDIDVSGLGILNRLLNTLVDFVALGIKTALSPLGMVPIPILQFADAFAQLGMLFDRSTSSSIADGSPFLGVAQNRSGIFLAADFQAANNTPGNHAVVQDILPSTMNVGAVINDRLINQTIATLLTNNSLGLVRSIPSGGTNFGINSIDVSFRDPEPGKPAYTSIKAHASASMKVRKGGIMRLFGKKKRVRVSIVARQDLVFGIEKDPNTQLSVLDFKFRVTVQGKVSIDSALAAIMMVILGPFITIFLTLLSQLLNFAFKFFLEDLDGLGKNRLKFDVSGSVLTVTIEKLAVNLSAGASINLGGLSSASLSARIDTAGSGSFELDHFTVHKFNEEGIPIAVDYFPDSIETRQGELFLGANLRNFGVAI